MCFQGTKRKPDHVGDTNKYTWRKFDCINKYSKLSQEEKEHLNYSAFAREYEFKQNG